MLRLCSHRIGFCLLAAASLTTAFGERTEFIRWTAQSRPIERQVRVNAATGEPVDHIVVLAGDLALGESLDFEFGRMPPAKPKVTIIADTLTFEKSVGLKASWNGNDAKWTNAPDFLVIARTLQFRTNGDLNFNLIQAREGWGDVRVFYERLIVEDRERNPPALPPGLTAEAREAWEKLREFGRRVTASVEPIRDGTNPQEPSSIFAAKGRVLFIPFRNDEIPRTNRFGRPLRPARLGRLELHPMSKAGDFVSPEILSQWTVEMQEMLLTRGQTARATGDEALAIQSYQKASSIARLGWLPTGEKRQKFAETLKGLSDLVPVVAESRVTVSPRGTVDRTLVAFFEKRTLDYRLAPTDTLVIPHVRQNRTVVGLVSFDPAAPEEIRIYFDLRLTVNPWLRALAAEKLGARGLAVGGMFDNWKLSAPKIKLEGVTELAIEIGPSVLQCSLRLNRDLATLALWRLRSSGGLPVTLAYECIADPNVKGQLPLTLSLARRSELELEADPKTGTVTNKARTPLTLDYFLLGQEIVTLSPALTIAPGTTAKLPIPSETDLAKLPVGLPPEAVLYSGVDGSSMDDFDFTGAGRMVDEVRVTNLLGNDPALGGSLHFVEVTVTYVLGEGPSATRTEAGPYRLAARAAQGSEVTVPFLRPSRGNYGFEVKGKAFWEHGQQDIQIKQTDRLAIKIDETTFSR